MNKRQVERYIRLRTSLQEYGVTDAEINTLLRCERTLQRWGERECGDGSDWAIERDEVTGKPYNVYHGRGESRRYPIADRETGAYNRALTICKARGLTAYHQGDCRGCNLYVIRPRDVPAGERIDSYYNRGIAICID